MSQKKAFTLIEMLVVVATIAILAGFVIIKINNSINAGKDVKRKADIELLANSLTNYSADSYSSKPVSSAPCVIGGSGADACSITINDVFKSSLPTLPIDPNSTYSYTYKNIGPICEIVAYLSTGDTYRYNCITNEGVVTPVISGACGDRANTSATGYASGTTDWDPSDDYCAQGTENPDSPVFPPNPGDSVSWRCIGDYKGTVALCNAYRAKDGTCGTADYRTPKIYADADASYGADTICGFGTASPASPAFPAKGTSTTWTCAGINNGTTASCESRHAANGVCGTANTTNSYTVPSGNPSLCNPGTAGTVTLAFNDWTWTCGGLFNGNPSGTCTTHKKIDGVCGPAATNYAYGETTYSSAYCTAGTASPASPAFPAQGGSVTWHCDGINTGNPSGDCIASRASAPVNGICGTANNTNSYTVPSGNPSLCNPGTASTITFASNNWTWTCAGSNGGTTSGTCTTHKKIDGVCGTAAKTYAYNATVYSGTICAVGTASPASPVFPAQGSSTTWTCAGSNGGTSPSCTATRNAPAPVNGVCGTAYNTNSYTVPSGDPALCSSGTASAINTGSSFWSWTCAGLNGGTTSDMCFTYITRDGVCMAPDHFSNFKIFSCGPHEIYNKILGADYSWCVVGDMINLSPNNYTGPWTWQCSGSAGGNTVNCSATHEPPGTHSNFTCGASSHLISGCSYVNYSVCDGCGLCTFQGETPSTETCAQHDMGYVDVNGYKGCI